MAEKRTIPDDAAATCKYCGQKMLPENGCTCKKVKVHGKTVDRLPNKEQDPCHDCRVKEGLFHHPGCDLEHCPECGKQMLMHKATFIKSKEKKEVKESLTAKRMIELLEDINT